MSWHANTYAFCRQARLVQLVAARELGLDKDIVSYRLRQLTLLLPDLSASLYDHRVPFACRALQHSCIGILD